MANYIYPGSARVSLTVVTVLLCQESPGLDIILTHWTLRHERKSKQNIFSEPRLQSKYFSVSVIILGQFESHLDVRSQALVRKGRVSSWPGPDSITVYLSLI